MTGAGGPKKSRLGDKMQVSTMAPPESGQTTKTDSRTGKYLAFQLGREEFAIQVLKVREIMGIQDITAVPQTLCAVALMLTAGFSVLKGWKERAVFAAALVLFPKLAVIGGL